MNRAVTIAAAVLAVAALFGAAPSAAQTLPVQELGRHTHVHGLAVDIRDATRLLIATHHGLFAADRTGTATRISQRADDFMGFTPHPNSADTLYASGHPATGGNLGVTVSTDGGQHWRPLATGVGGPVDFHQMTISRVDPARLYGAFRGLQRSDDGGRTWRIVGPAPEGLIALSASVRDRDTLYAATQSGLLVSADAGASWRRAHPLARPATAVDAAADGTVRAFIVGIGLVAMHEAGGAWTTLGPVQHDGAVLHLAAGPDRIYAATDRGAILESADGGRSWGPFPTVSSPGR